MKLITKLTAALLSAAFLSAPFAAFAAEATANQDAKAAKSKYPLKTCVVSDEELGSMGKAYVFKHEGKEVQLCCKSCQKDFKKDPKKYMKKLSDAEKKAAAKP